MKLYSRILSITLIPIVIFFAVFIITYFTLFQNNLIDSQISEASSLLELTSAELANSLYFLDIEEIDQILDKLEDNENVLNAFVFTLDGKMISDFEINIFTNSQFLEQALHANDIIYQIDSDTLTLSEAITIENQIGIIIMEYSLKHINQILLNSFLGIIGISLISSGVAGLLSFFSNKKITDHLLKISKYSEDITLEKVPKKIENSNIDELDDIRDSLEIMRQNLESSKHELIKTERLSSIGELAARLAHDLRNPLTVITGAIEIISQTKENQLTPKTVTHLEMIKNQTERLNHQVNNVLDFVRSKELNLSTVSFKSFLENVLGSIKIPENITITQPENETKLTIDVEQTRVVFINLINNAIQAIKDNTGEIDIRISEKDDFIYIELEDSGPGIEPKNLNRVFDPLFTTKQEGTGLGLASCKTIIKEHGGKIQVKNGESGGALFRITLPKKIPGI